MGRGFKEGHDESIGRKDHAGMPKEVRMEEYPKGSRLTMNEGLDDTMSEIDGVQEHAEGKRKRYLSNQK